MSVDDVNFSDLCPIHHCSVFVWVCHGSVPAFIRRKSHKRDCTSCGAHTHTHTLAAISHYTTLPMKMCVCVGVRLNAKVVIERREGVIYSEKQCCSSLLLPPSLPPRRSSAHSPCSIIHTSPSSIHQNVHSVIISVITIYQIVSKNYSAG